MKQLNKFLKTNRDKFLWEKQRLPKKQILSILLSIGILVSLFSPRVFASTSTSYIKMDNDVFGQIGESILVDKDSYRGVANYTSSQKNQINNNGYKNQKRKSKIIYVEYGTYLIERFLNGNSYTDTLYFNKECNTGGYPIDFNYNEIIDYGADANLFNQIIGNKNAKGIYDVLNKDNFNQNELVNISKTSVRSNETEENVYLITMKHNNNISKYVLKAPGELKLNPEKPKGEEITINFNTRANSTKVPSIKAKSGDIITPPKDPVYNRVESSTGIYTKDFNAWFYENRNHYTKIDFSKPITRDLNAHISWNDQFRLSGKNRYETANKVANRFGSSRYAIISNGNNFSDSIAGSALANIYDAPLLLVEKDTIYSSTINMMRSLGVEQVFIIGGDGSVSSKVVNSLSASSIKTSRISGKNRFETSTNIGQHIINNSDYPIEDIVLVNGFDFPDALSGTNISNRKNCPIILSDKASLDNSATSFIDNNKIKKITIVGGSNSISGNIENTLINKGLEVNRIAGRDRYETSFNTVKYLNTQSHSTTLASGTNFADGVVAGAYSAQTGNPLLLVPRDGDIPQYMKNYFKDVGAHEVTTIGGESSVSDQMQNNVSNVTK